MAGDPILDALSKAGADAISGFCPPRTWERQNICDVHYLNYSYNMRVDNQLVEVTLRYRIERCTLDYVLSDLAHSITLFPGEEVFLSTRTKTSVARFTEDASISASQSYRSSDRVWMESFKSAATNFSASDNEASRTASHSDYSNTSEGGGGGVNLLVFSIGGSASHASGNFDASSSAAFQQELNQHLVSTLHQTNQVTRDSMSVSMSQINSHRDTTTETHEELEVSTRRFKNDNECHTVTHYFYQIAKKQHVKITLESRTLRALNSFAETAARSKPVQLSIATNAKPNFDVAAVQPSDVGIARGTLTDQQLLQQANATPYDTILADEKARLAAVAKVQQMISDQKTDFTYESDDIIPTEALYVESELGSCMLCEPTLVAKQGYELEKLRLENELLQKQIDLLAQYKDYRCCDETTTTPSS